LQFRCKFTLPLWRTPLKSRELEVLDELTMQAPVGSQVPNREAMTGVCPLEAIAFAASL
jgi:hypothetical protein